MINFKDFNRLFLAYAEPVDAAGTLTPQELSEGFCYYWAYVFQKVYGGMICSHLTPDFTEGHAFVSLNGKFFDYQHPEGVDSPKDLYPAQHDYNRFVLHIHPNDEDFFQNWFIDPKFQRIFLNSARKLNRIKAVGA